MKKIDYEKAEFLFHKGVDDMDVAQVREDALAVLSGRKLNVVRGAQRTQVSKLVAVKVIRMIAKDLKAIKDASPEAYKKLQGMKENVQKILDNVDNLTEEDWERLKAYKLQLSEKRVKLVKGSEKEYVEGLISEEQDDLLRRGKYSFVANPRWQSV